MQTSKPLAFCESCYEEMFDKENIKHHRSLRHTVIETAYVEKQTPKKQSEIKKVKGKIGTYFVESIILDNKPYFLCNNDTKLELKEKIEYDEKIYKPLEKAECGYFPYEFTIDELDGLIQKKLSKENLLNELKEIINFYIDIDERDKILVLGDLLLSYCQEWINTLHFLYAVGETESGKSTILHLFRWLSYRCLYGEDIPNADIYNFLGTDEEATGTIAEDEAQDIAVNRQKMRTYKNSYSRGSLKAIITNADSHHKKQVYYKTFCFKLFAGEMVPENKGFRERLAILHMVEGMPKGNIKDVSQNEKNTLNRLRNSLLVWKVQNIHNGLDQTDSKLVKRDKELWGYFLKVLYGTKYQKEGDQVVDYYVRQRHQSIWQSLEAQVFKLITKRIKDNRINLENFWQYLTTDNTYFKGRLEKETFYPHDFVDKVTRNSLSNLFEDKFQAIKRTFNEFDENKKKHKVTKYEFKPEIIQKLAIKYNISFSSSGEGGEGGESNATTLTTSTTLDKPTVEAKSKKLVGGS